MAQACYQKLFLPASFKGFAFDAMSAGSEHGRRGAEGEFPFGEDTRYLDMGRKIRQYTIKARFVTNDHIAQANAFIATIESTGPGLLVHPTRGGVQAACKNAKVSDEILEEYGVTYVDCDFVEANDSSLGVGLTNIYGIPIVNFVGLVSSQFTNIYNPTLAPFYETPVVLQSAVAAQNVLNTGLQSVLSNPPVAAWSVVSMLTRMAAAPENNYSTTDVLNSIQSGFAAIDRYATDGESKYAAFKTIANANASSSKLLSSIGNSSENAIFATMRLLSAAYMARAASQITPSTMMEAIGWVDTIEMLLQQEQDAATVACYPDFYLAIKMFKANALAQLTYAAYNAPVNIVYSFNGPISSHVAAYRVYGDAKRFVDIEAANPNMPCFAMGPDIVATKVAA